jgi:hypothetical protein
LLGRLFQGTAAAASWTAGLALIAAYLNWLRLLLTRVCIAALFAGFGAAVSQAAVPILPVCSWPFEVTGQGITNIATNLFYLAACNLCH